MNKEKIHKVENAVKIFTYSTGLLSFVILFGKISPLFYFLALILFLASIYLEYQKIHIKRVFINLSAILLVIIKFYDIILDPVQHSLGVLLFLLSLKFFEEKRFRDYMQIYLIAVLILAGSTLISFNIVFLVYLVLYILILNISIILLTYSSQDREIDLSEKVLVKIFLKTSLMPILAIPFTAFFFIILPRTDFPIFSFLNKSAKAKTGFSENIRLGELSEIQEDNIVIFRAKTKKLKDELLYWRGITLNFFDGKTWISIKSKEIQNKVILKGLPVVQIIYLEPYGDRYLFGLDKPYNIDYQYDFTKPSQLANFTFNFPTPIFSRIKYKVISILTEVISEKSVNTELYLQIPQNISSKIRNLALSLKGKDDEETAIKILKFLKYGNYRYSLKGLPISSNPLEDFLFKYKYGNCEYFASSMAILLRLNGIPARLVAGYKGGIYNEIGGYYLVRESDAHVWVEAFIKDKGWVRYDPTPSSTYPLKGENAFSKVKFIFETINYYYINFVLSYDFNKQVALFRNISNLAKISRLKFNKNLLLLFSGFILITGLVGVLLAKNLRVFKKLKEEEKLIREFLKFLETKGYKKNETEGLEEFALKIKENKLKALTLDFVKIFEEDYYKDKPFNKEKLNKLRKILNEIKNSA